MRLIRLACATFLATSVGAALSQVPAVSDFAPGTGQEQTAAACAACHPATIVTGKRLTAEKWSEVVNQMVDKGAKVSDANFDVIVAYLARAYGAEVPKPAAAPATAPSR